MEISDFFPKWIQILYSPSVKTILITGCGGGFDFSHSLLIIPDLIKMDKRIIIVSNSFSSINESYYNYETVFSKNDSILAKKVIPNQEQPQHGYIPEKIFIDTVFNHYPNAKIELYATSAHSMPAPIATEFLSNLCRNSNVDVILTIDGGSDSIMRGDENEIATVAEDFTSLVTIQNLMKDKSLNIKHGILTIVGLGADRIHGASDASSLRAVAELTRMGGFLGSNSINQNSVGFKIYSQFLLKSKKNFQTIVGCFVAAATVGQFGPVHPNISVKPVPRDFQKSGIPEECIKLFSIDEKGENSDTINNFRVEKETTYIWPIMSQFYSFDVGVVLERCLLADDVKGLDGYTGTSRIRLETMGQVLPNETFPVFDCNEYL